MTSLERRLSTGGTAPCKVFIGKSSHGEFKDHAGRHYDVVASRAGPNAAIVKLSIQLYCLGVGEAIRKMKDDAVTGLSEAEAKEKLATEIQGMEPLPHIVPSWCESTKFVENRWSVGDRYKSWIFVVPAQRSSWEDVIENGLLKVKFDLDVSAAMFYSESPTFGLTPGGEGWVLVEKTGVENMKPVEILHICAREERGTSEITPGSDATLFGAWCDATMQLRDCTYKPKGCKGCRSNEPHGFCEQEMDEHFNDEDGQCVACRREEEEEKRLGGQQNGQPALDTVGL
ncbi:hypothetical protein FOBRF1_014206 [Fusarium oxysporum]